MITVPTWVVVLWLLLDLTSVAVKIRLLYWTRRLQETTERLNRMP